MRWNRNRQGLSIRRLFGDSEAELLRGGGETEDTDITDGSYWTILTRERLSHLLGVAEVTFYAGVAHA